MESNRSPNMSNSSLRESSFGNAHLRVRGFRPFIEEPPVTRLKIVLKLALEDESRKRKALKMVAGVQGVDSVAVDMKDKKMTVIGDVDPVYLTSKLRKFSSAELVSVGPAKEEKKEGEKKEEKKPESDAKKNKAEAPKYEVVYVPPSYDSRAVSEENPNACVIC
ncbi:hypothetical protein SUGI_0123170 [Cryptomeria japonica]|nr:hypothetical protein SUGI_0123170 [Cryptomeria japonica]